MLVLIEVTIRPGQELQVFQLTHRERRIPIEVSSTTPYTAVMQVPALNLPFPTQTPQTLVLRKVPYYSSEASN